MKRKYAALLGVVAAALLTLVLASPVAANHQNESTQTFATRTRPGTTAGGDPFVTTISANQWADSWSTFNNVNIFIQVFDEFGNVTFSCGVGHSISPEDFTVGEDPLSAQLLTTIDATPCGVGLIAVEINWTATGKPSRSHTNSHTSDGNIQSKTLTFDAVVTGEQGVGATSASISQTTRTQTVRPHQP